MQKSILVPYDKYMRLVSLQDSLHNDKNTEKSEEIKNTSTELLPSENATSEMNTQTDDVQDEGMKCTDVTKDESLQPLIPDKPTSKMTFKNKASKYNSRYKLHKKWIRF